MCEHFLIVKLEKLFTHTHPVPYQVSENKGTNHEAYNHTITTTVTFVMKYMIVSKDPTQNKTGFSQEKPFKNMIRLHWKLNILSFMEKRLFLAKSSQIFNDLNFCKVTELTDILLTFTATPRVSNISLGNWGWLISEGGTRKKDSFFGILKYRCYASQENFQTWL